MPKDEATTTYPNQQMENKKHEFCLEPNCGCDITAWREMGLGEHWHYDEQGNKYFKGVIRSVK